MIRLAIILVVSGFVKLPMATSCGAADFSRKRVNSKIRRSTLRILGLSKKDTGFLSIDHGPVGRSNVS